MLFRDETRHHPRAHDQVSITVYVSFVGKWAGFAISNLLGYQLQIDHNLILRALGMTLRD